jgi:hypothetical protein
VALLTKFLEKFYSKMEVPWVQQACHAYYSSKVPRAENLCGSIWWKDVLKHVDNFIGVLTMARVTPSYFVRVN